MTEAEAIVLLRDAVNGLASTLSAVMTDMVDAGLFAILLLIPTFLTWAMFHSKSMMLGFPCAIFWAILGGYARQQSVVTWDWQYLVFFAAFGMTVFSAFAAYGLRTRKEELAEGDEYADEGEDDTKFIDEGSSQTSDKAPETDETSQRVQGVRDRASKRRGRVRRRPNYGEFK